MATRQRPPSVWPARRVAATARATSRTPSTVKSLAMTPRHPSVPNRIRGGVGISRRRRMVRRVTRSSRHGVALLQPCPGPPFEVIQPRLADRRSHLAGHRAPDPFGAHKDNAVLLEHIPRSVHQRSYWDMDGFGKMSLVPFRRLPHINDDQ